MGVYIPTAEMPHNLLECFYGEQCQEYEDCNGLERGKKCPLIEIDETEWEWCHDCKEYDQESHCCHRWTKVIRKTVEDVKESYKIVTCVECKHSKEWYGDRRLCYLWAEAGVSVFEDGYCNYGERRDE